MVIFDNDVNWVILVEKSFGIVKNVFDFVFIYFGEGIGVGIYLDNYLIRGLIGIFGEIGYIMVNSKENL